MIGGVRVDGTNTRDNVSAYLEFDADVSDRLNIQLAGRYENYSDFGQDWNGKAAARFEIVDGFAIRASASTGFRAPSLQQQFYATQATNNVNGVLLETVTLPVDTPVAQILGSSPLAPETSVSFSAGITANPFRALNITIDAYQIEIDDRIVVTENLGSFASTATQTAVRNLLAANGFPFVTAARFFINGIDARTRGFDAVATYRFNLGDIKVRASVGYNYNETKITGRLAALGPLATIPGLELFGRQESLRIERGQPEDQINLGLDIDYKMVGVTARANRFGKVLAAGGELGPFGSGVFNDLTLDAAWVTDSEVRVRSVNAIELAVGANNVFDSYPEPAPTGLAGVSATNGANVFFPATNYVANFSAFSPYGLNGRFLYARAALRF